MYAHRTFLVVGALVAGLAACATSPRAVSTRTSTGDVSSPAANAVSLVVRNDNFHDVDVFAIADGQRTRLGMVTGNKTARFRLDPALFPTGQVQIVATPVGAKGVASSGPVNVTPGQTVQFTIAPRLEQSTVQVR